jgi:hypothetical protein
LVPFDTRLESIDACERLFRDTRTRYSTDNIGLAKVKEGLELVRIGHAQRPEFAGWRYGDAFGKRRRRAIVVIGGFSVAAVGVAAFGLVAGVGMGAFSQIPFLSSQYYLHRRVAVRIPRPQGRPIELSEMQAGQVEILKWENGELSLRTPVYRKLFAQDNKKYEFVGEDFDRLLPALLAKVNGLGGTQATIDDAVSLVARHRSAFDLVWKGTPSSRALYFGPINTIGALAPEWRLAAEIACNEEGERKALAGELRLLEWQWREAERLAKLADGLALGEG